MGPPVEGTWAEHLDRQSVGTVLMYKDEHHAVYRKLDNGSWQSIIEGRSYPAKDFEGSMCLLVWALS